MAGKNDFPDDTVSVWLETGSWKSVDHIYLYILFTICNDLLPGTGGKTDSGCGERGRKKPVCCERSVIVKFPVKPRNISGASVGTEELAHLEIVGAIVHQLTRDLTPEEIESSGFDKYYVDHTLAVWPQAAGGIPFNTCEFQCKGDPITDLVEDMAAEQKARSTYDNILRLVKDPEVADPIRFLRAREIVHFQRFGEALRLVTDKLNEKNFYAFNPAIDCSGR